VVVEVLAEEVFLQFLIHTLQLLQELMDLVAAEAEVVKEIQVVLVQVEVLVLLL
jgi:hypothetical protein